MILTDERVTPSNDSSRLHFAISASDLGWRAGEWRRMIPTTMGNGQAFVLQAVEEDGAKYRQQLGQTLLTVRGD